MSDGLVKISQEAVGILEQVTCDGSKIYLPGTLERATYLKVSKILNIVGAPWDRRTQSHLFANGEDATSVIGDIVAQGYVIDEKKLLQQFYTPLGLAEELVNWAGVEKSSSVLEPSAGKGSIAEEILTKFPASMTAVEIDPKAYADLYRLFMLETGTNSRFIQDDFLSCHPDTLGKFSHIVMNPPFSKGQECRHVIHALNFLQGSGTLVSVMSAGFQFRVDGKYGVLKKILSSGFDYEVRENRADTFKVSGTRVNTVQVKIKMK